MEQTIVSAQNVYKSYSTGGGTSLDVLRGATLEVQSGSVCAIVGASGSGKSTLLHILGALDRPDAGEVLLDGQDMFTLDDAALAGFRNGNMGFVFQFHHLLPEFSAVENVAIPAMIGGSGQAEAQDRAMELLKLVHVDHRAQARPSEMSGGEQQRVAVARALVNTPSIVLADEPSGNLDEENASLLHDMLWELSRQQGQTFILVTHDAELARRADASWRLHDGLLVREG